MADQGKTILIIGASRGLGLGLAREYLERGWRVVATTRGGNEAAIADLAASSGGRLQRETLDVTDFAAVDALAGRLTSTPLDMLFVSAGVSSPEKQAPIGSVSVDEFDRVMVTNALAPLRIIEALGERVARDGVIVAMSSVLGSVAGNTSGGYELYRASKAALNTLLRSYAARHRERSVVAMHPGWVRTDMGGAQASVGVEESVAGMADVLERLGGKPGCVYVDYLGETIPW